MNGWMTCHLEWADGWTKGNGQSCTTSLPKQERKRTASKKEKKKFILFKGPYTLTGAFVGNRQLDMRELNNKIIILMLITTLLTLH